MACHSYAHSTSQLCGHIPFTNSTWESQVSLTFKILYIHHDATLFDDDCKNKYQNVNTKKTSLISYSSEFQFLPSITNGNDPTADYGDLLKRGLG